MKIESSQVTKIRLSELDRLDPVTVILEDIEPRKGKIIIECYGQSWSSYWGGMGDRTITEFFCSCNNEYLIGNLSSGLRCTVEDCDNLDEWMKRGVIDQRKERNLDANDARELWDEIDLWCENDPQFLYGSDGARLALKCIGEEWWNSLPQKENSDYQYLSRIVDAVKAGISANARGNV
jgi:hypothetical protein